MKILCTTFALVLGLYFFRNNLALSIIISLIYLIFIFFRFSKKFAAVLLLVFIGGCFLGHLNIEYNSNENSYQGMVVEVKENYFLFQSHFEKYYVYEKNTDKEVGDFLTIVSKPETFKATTYESQFNFESYLKDKGVKRSLPLKECQTHFQNPFRIHSRKQLLLSSLDEDAKVLVNALLFNEKDYSSNAITSFDSLNLIYLVSVSGIYIRILFTMTTYIFGLFSSKKVSEAVPIIMYSPLTILSFPRISILRVFLISLLKYINDHFLKKRFSYLTLLSSLALFFLIIDYHLVYQEAFYVGFLLSLLGVYLRNSLNQFPKKKRKILIIPFAYLFLLPLTIQNGNVLHCFSFLFQLILIPFFLLLLVFSLAFLLFSMVKGLINPYATFLVGISKSLQRFDLTLPIMVNEWFILVYYVLFVAIIFLLESQRIRHTRNVIVALASIVLLTLTPINITSKSIYFINVGQGDSILIKDRNKTVMIDTGGNTSFDMARETLIPFFNKIGVRHLDLLVTTHDDFDHAGAASSLIENFKVYNYYHQRDNFPCQVGNIYLENINFYDGDENDSSLVFLLDFMDKKWMFTGDASIASEKSIINSGINIDCDILKVAHHGSSTSSCEEFIKATSPSEAIISCGAKNKYGHPNQEVIERLQKYNVKIRRTDIEGTISYVSIFA